MRLTPILLLLAHATWLGAQQLYPVADTCTLPPLPRPGPSWQSFDLPDSLGTVRLAPLTVAGPLGTNPHGRKFILEDSTVIEVWVTPEPVMSFMSTGQVGQSAYASCRTTIGGKPAFVTRIALTKSGGTVPSVFVGLTNITMDSTQTINVAVTTATAASRDDALRLVTLLHFRASTR